MKTKSIAEKQLQELQGNLFLNRKQRRRLAKLNKTPWNKMPKITKQENDYFTNNHVLLTDINYKYIQDMKRKLYLDRKAKRAVEKLQQQEIEKENNI
jgi:hypothetical protein